MLISLVVPCFNEAENIPELAKHVRAVLADEEFEVILVDDGSSDHTIDVLRELHASDPRFRWISFSRNFGHQSALRAGLDHAQGDCVVSLDADMQHPVELIPTMIARWRDEGYDVVYTVRNDTNHSSKAWLSTSFYRVLNWLSDIHLEPGSADFRLLDRKVVDALGGFAENPIFYRGLIDWVGFRSFSIGYEPAPRFAGRSKYTFTKMVRLAMSGLLGFSTKPLLFSIYLGLFCAISALAYAVVIVVMTLAGEATVSGWPTVVSIVLFLGGMQLVVLGIIGIYLGHHVIEAKGRPPYLIRESV